MTASGTATARQPVTGWPGRALLRLRMLAGQHRLFTWALAVGAVLRLLAILGYPGALWFAGDSYVYLGAALRPQPNLSKSTGYSFFLRALLPFHSLTLVTVVQHLMGLAVAVMIYALLRRNHVPKLWSTAATLPVLLDGYLIENEHLIMAETLFIFLLMAALILLLWWRQVPWWAALAAGLLAGYAVDVRTEGAVVLVLDQVAVEQHRQSSRGGPEFGDTVPAQQRVDHYRDRQPHQVLNHHHQGQAVERQQRPQEERVAGRLGQVGLRAEGGAEVDVGVPGEPQRARVPENREQSQHRADGERRDEQPVLPDKRADA